MKHVFQPFGRRLCLGCCLLLAGARVEPAHAQAPLYFPPIAPADTTWARVSPQTLNWNLVALDTVLAYAGRQDSRALLILQDGRLAVEKYYGSFTKDSIWYWASAGKSLTATLVGLAQQDGNLQIGQSVTQYLGAGWTSASPAQEQLITVRHLLTMTAGLDDNLPPTPANPDPNTCSTAPCLRYLAPAGTRWAYHTGAYRRLLDVLATTSGQPISLYTAARLGSRIGMRGLWVEGIFRSRARDMARFGLLTLARGIWNGNPILTDTAYFRQMLRPAQAFNRSYGYLWWLNGQGSYMLPQSQVVFPADLAPAAPADLVAALGKNDQRLYVVPSLGLVVVRMGRAGGQPPLALSVFDNELWTRLMSIFQQPTARAETPAAEMFSLAPNPATESVRLTLRLPYAEPGAPQVRLFDATGQCVGAAALTEGQFSVRGLAAGLYWVRVTAPNGRLLGQRQLMVAP